MSTQGSVDISILNSCEEQCNCNMQTQTCSHILCLYGTVVLASQRNMQDSLKDFATQVSQQLNLKVLWCHIDKNTYTTFT